MANQSDVEGRTTSATTMSPLNNTFILPISSQDAGWSEEVNRRYDEAIPIERPLTKTETMLGDGFVGGCLSTY